MMKRGSERWGVAVAVAVTVYLGGCAAQDQHRPFFHDDEGDMPEFSHSRIGDSWEDDSVADFLRPEERDALRRSGTSALRTDDLDAPEEDAAADPLPEEPQGGSVGRALDKAGKVAVSALGVGITVGMIVAPYFLF